MKTNFTWRVMVGAVLVIFGVLALLQNFAGWNLEGTGWGIFLAVLFGVVGAGFIVSYLQDRSHSWWAVIPGFTLMGLALLVLLGVMKVTPNELLPALFMGSIGASFWVIYLSDRTRWWAIIPGGVLVSLALLILLSQQGSWPAVILFGGMAVTFSLVALLAGPADKPRTWAWWPAGSLAVLAVIVATTTGPLPGLIWPILLIGSGLLMVVWTLFRKNA